MSDEKNVSYPILNDFEIKGDINFHVLKWHDRFDALIGTHDLKRLKEKIDYSDNTLKIVNNKIPFFIELNPLNFTRLKQNISNIIKMLVNIENGPVQIPEIKIEISFYKSQ